MDGDTARESACILLLQMNASICSRVLVGLKQIPISSLFSMF